MTEPSRLNATGITFEDGQNMEKVVQDLANCLPQEHCSTGHRPTRKGHAQARTASVRTYTHSHLMGLQKYSYSKAKYNPTDEHGTNLPHDMQLSEPPLSETGCACWPLRAPAKVQAGYISSRR
jgi:hypothetical protein